MALIKCIECGHEISKSAKNCPKCGAKIKRTTLFTKVAAALLGLGFVGAAVNNFATPPTTPAAAKPAAPQTEEQRAKQEDDRLQSLGLKWRYTEEKDEMGRGVIRYAEVQSINLVKFGFPYNGEQRASLNLRKHPKHGKDAYLQLTRGHFLCGFDGCTVSVRFDNGKVQSFQATLPSDHDTKALFINGHDRLAAALKKAKVAAIEAEFYQEGTRVFEFNVSGLNW